MLIMVVNPSESISTKYDIKPMMMYLDDATLQVKDAGKCFDV